MDPEAYTGPIEAQIQELQPVWTFAHHRISIPGRTNKKHRRSIWVTLSKTHAFNQDAWRIWILGCRTRHVIIRQGRCTDGIEIDICEAIEVTSPPMRLIQ